MPKVRWLQSVVGEDFERQADDITDESDDDADIWADGVRAVRVERERKPETTMREAPEAAVERGARRSR